MTDYSNDETQLDRSMSAPPLPAFDPAAYRAHLAAFELTEAQERELLETLWQIMHGFVELGFQFDVCAAVFGDGETVAGDEAGT